MTDATILPEITEDTVRAWLRDAKVPEPWRPDGIALTARTAIGMRENYPAMAAQAKASSKKKGSERSPFEWAQAAIAELRRALKKLEPLMDAEQQAAIEQKMPGDTIAQQEATLAKVRHMQASLVSIAPEKFNADKMLPPHHQVAIAAYQCFCLIVSNCHINASDENPAGNFVRSFALSIGITGSFVTNSTLAGILPKQDKLAEQDFLASHLPPHWRLVLRRAHNDGHTPSVIGQRSAAWQLTQNPTPKDRA